MKSPEYTRRQVLKVAALFLVNTFVPVPNILLPRTVQTRSAEAAVRPTIVEKPVSEVELAEGGESFPFLPPDSRVGGLINTGLNEGGAADKYDAIDRAINGDMARCVYWPKMGGPASTREWLKQTGEAGLVREDEYNREGILVRKSNWRSHGYCQDAIAASKYSPKIVGPIVIDGIEVSEWERQAIATWRYAGMARDPEFTNIDNRVIEWVQNELAQGSGIAANYSAIEDEDWWALVVRVNDDGTFLLTKNTNYGGKFLNQGNYDPHGIRAVAKLNPERWQQNREGQFKIIDREIGGLILGTHRLA